MAPSLPLELQHYILKLAIPPFSYRTLPARREACRLLALVHRSWTPIAQAELQRCFRISGRVDQAGWVREKALVQRAVDEAWKIDELAIEEDGAPVDGERTTCLPHQILSGVKRAVVAPLFSEAALRSSTLPSLRELTIVESPVETLQYHPDNSVPSHLFFPTLTRLHLVQVLLDRLPPLAHLQNLLLTNVGISSHFEIPSELP
ncbi:hypothetical protein JCM6882_004919 [Rhodosporidiobolus microsporus]